MAEGDGSTDRGFTLVETLVVLLMVGVLATVMVSVIAVILKNVPGTEARADDSRTYQRLIQWLPRDAASTPPGQFDSTGPWLECVGATGKYLARMSWPGDSGTSVAEYRLVPDAPGGRVKRFTCSSDAGYADTETLEVTSELFAATLKSKGVDATLRVPPGPHDQPWLREAGTIEALHWLDRVAWQGETPSRPLP